jgi:hypothetical protein
MTSSLLSALPRTNKTIIPNGFLLVVIGVIIIAILTSSSIFTVLASNQTAFATFPGENGKIVFSSIRDGNDEIYVMNADGSDQHNLSNNPDGGDLAPDWGIATETEPEDTTPPVITVPEDITEEATSSDGPEVSFEVSAEDDVDGAVNVNCDYDSGDTFPIGKTVVTCSAVDAAGNRAEKSFTITVQDTTDSDVEITRAVDRRSNTEIPNGGITPIPYIRITFEATDAAGIDETECSLDVGAFTSCTSPIVYDRLSRGTHQVIVRATDEAGNT